MINNDKVININPIFNSIKNASNLIEEAIKDIALTNVRKVVRLFSYDCNHITYYHYTFDNEGVKIPVGSLSLSKVKANDGIYLRCNICGGIIKRIDDINDIDYIVDKNIYFTLFEKMYIAKSLLTKEYSDELESIINKGIKLKYDFDLSLVKGLEELYKEEINILNYGTADINEKINLLKTDKEKYEFLAKYL